MTATISPTPSDSDWEETLTAIGVDASFISRTLISALEDQGLTDTTLNYESFGGIVEAGDQLAAGIEFAQESSHLHALQDLLIPAVDWQRAWEELAKIEGYTIIPTHLPTYWAVFRTNDELG
jgi:hypothetical protein